MTQCRFFRVRFLMFFEIVFYDFCRFKNFLTLDNIFLSGVAAYYRLEGVEYHLSRNVYHCRCQKNFCVLYTETFFNIKVCVIYRADKKSEQQRQRGLKVTA